MIRASREAFQSSTPSGNSCTGSRLGEALALCNEGLHLTAPLSRGRR